ncbi:MAG: translation initiation factor IF-3 [Proteobacteria bacterium]|nr:MAG: translation initiation factor IF-3 [Pseudomonadota bacterium]
MERVFLKVLERADIRMMKEVRLVGEGRNEIVQALEALRIAEEEGLNLVLVSAPEAIPPVVRIEDFKKLQYEKKKKQKANRQTSDLKEIQLKANITDHDMQTKVSAIDKFLTRGDKVKVVVRLKGRERDNPQRAHDLVDRVIAAVSVASKAHKIPGPIATAIIEPGAKA